MPERLFNAPVRWVALLLGAVLLLPVGDAAPQLVADEPAPPASKPQWERMLNEEGRRKAAELEAEVDAKTRAGEFKKAIAPAEELARLRSRLQGADHWQAVSAARLLDFVKRGADQSDFSRSTLAAALASSDDGVRLFKGRRYEEARKANEEALKRLRQVFDRDGVEAARSAHGVACCLDVLGRPAEAEPYYRLALETYARELGDDHPWTAQVANNLGMHLSQKRRFAEATKLLERSLASRRRVLGEDHLDTAVSYQNCGTNLDAQFLHREAEPLLRKALEIRLRLLGAREEDAATAETRNNLGTNLDDQGRYEEAEREHRKALETRLRVLPKDDPAIGQSYSNLAACLKRQDKWPEAEEMMRKAVAVWERLPDQAREETIGYNNLGLLLMHRGKFDEAEEVIRRALKIRLRILKPNDPDLAFSYNSRARVLQEQGREADAQPLLEKALEVWLAVDPLHRYAAVSYGNLGTCLHRRGKYAEAEAQMLKQLRLQLLVLPPNDLNFAFTYNNLAANLDAQGRFAEAEPYLRKALEIFQRSAGENHSLTATAWNNLGLNLQDQEKYKEAEAALQRALDIYLRVPGGAPAEAANVHVNLALNHHRREDYEKAVELGRKALDLCKRLGEEQPLTLAARNNLGAALEAWGKFEEAGQQFQLALDARVRLLPPEHPDVILSFDNLAANCHSRGDDERAEKLWRKAASNFEADRLYSGASGLQRAGFATSRSPVVMLAALLARRHKPAEAWQRLEDSLGRGLLDDVSARRLRRLVDADSDREADLLGQLLRLDESLAALSGIGRELTAEQRGQREALQKKRAALQGNLKGLEDRVLTKNQVAAGKVYSLAEVQAELPADTALIAWVDLNDHVKAADPAGDHWACVVRRQGDPAWVQLRGSGADGSWTKDDLDLPRRLREGLATFPKNLAANLRPLAEKVAARRLGALEPHLAAADGRPAVRHLIILPSTALAGVPIECLTECVKSRYTVSYAPSGTMFAWLKKQSREARERHKDRPPRLLAVGDPVFRKPAPVLVAKAPDHGVLFAAVEPGSSAARAGLAAGDVIVGCAGKEVSDVKSLQVALGGADPGRDLAVMIWRDGTQLDRKVPPGRLGVLPSPRPAAEVINRQREHQALSRSGREDSWKELLYAGQEIASLARLCREPEPTVLTRERATCRNVNALAAADKMADYRYVHFATHGRANDRVAMQSWLALSDDGTSDTAAALGGATEPSDGRITAEQILHGWRLDADLVTLSACSTGLGKAEGGEGYVGFAQALFVAGGRCIVLSQWEIDDKATALLMTRFYENLTAQRDGLKEPLRRGEALREAKEWLRGLTDEQAHEAEKRLPSVTRGKPRERSTPAPAARPYAHPHFWAGFILIGDPE